MNARERRRALLGPMWMETVDELRKRGMAGATAYRDRDEVIGPALLGEWDQAVPVSPSEWTAIPHRGGGKPRGLSVNRGNRDVD
jgi:hypothetical protein